MIYLQSDHTLQSFIIPFHNLLVLVVGDYLGDKTDSTLHAKPLWVVLFA